MDKGDEVSSEHSGQEHYLREEVERSERELEGLERKLGAIDSELEALADEHHQYELLSSVCRSLEELDSMGGAHLFWEGRDADELQADRLNYARRKIDEFGEKVSSVESRREGLDGQAAVG